MLYPFPSLLTPFSTLLTTFPRTFILKSNAINGRNPPYCLFPVIEFIDEEATDCINEEVIVVINKAAIGAIIVPENRPSCFFISVFTVSIAPSINRPDFYSETQFQ